MNLNSSPNNQNLAAFRAADGSLAWSSQNENVTHTAQGMYESGYGYVLGYNYLGGHANTPWPLLSGGQPWFSPQKLTEVSTNIGPTSPLLTDMNDWSPGYGGSVVPHGSGGAVQTAGDFSNPDANGAASTALGATGGSHHALERQTGESVVLVREAPANLAFAPVLSEPVAIRSTYRDGLPQTTHYQPGQDYLLDASGEIRRTRGSRIPDFGTNILYGKEDFRHDQFPGFGNGRFFVYVDYAHRERWERPPANADFGVARLPRTRQKLQAGAVVRLVAFGDSITAGGEASEPGLIFWERWGAALRLKYPRATIETTNGATGGDATVQGLQRVQEKVLQQKPDLVLIGFGMNDHNREGYGVPLDKFAANLRTLISRIRAGTGAEIVLFSAFPPNPKWHFGSHNMQAYAEATERVAREEHCAFADVYHYWMSLAARKKPEDLLANNINHPNDYGHWIYFQALQGIGL